MPSLLHKCITEIGWLRLLHSTVCWLYKDKNKHMRSKSFKCFTSWLILCFFFLSKFYSTWCLLYVCFDQIRWEVTLCCFLFWVKGLCTVCAVLYWPYFSFSDSGFQNQPEFQLQPLFHVQCRWAKDAQWTVYTPVELYPCLAVWAGWFCYSHDQILCFVQCACQ